MMMIGYYDLYKKQTGGSQTSLISKYRTMAESQLGLRENILLS